MKIKLKVAQKLGGNMKIEKEITSAVGALIEI